MRRSRSRLTLPALLVSRPALVLIVAWRIAVALLLVVGLPLVLVVRLSITVALRWVM